MPRKIEISHKTIIFTVFFLLSLWILYIIRDIILEFFLALLIVAVLDPMVSKLSQRKVPRSLSVIVVYVLLFSVFGLILASIVPSLVQQTSAFITNLPSFLSNIGISTFMSEQLINETITQVGTLPAKVAMAAASVFSNILGIAAILVFAYYLLSEREDLKKQIALLVGDKREYAFDHIIDLVEEKLGSWARAEIILMFVVGLANYIGFRLLNIPFALPLSILAGFLEIVPYMGPLIAAVPATLIGFGISPVIGFATAALAFLIQQMENYILVPKIMQKNTGINPVITLVVLAIGARLAGVMGLLVAVPIFITIQEISREYLIGQKASSAEV